jgi:deoxyguanosine kinase
MNHNFFLSIEGLIGVGKTTLAGMLKPVLDAELILEIGSGNPYLEYYFEDKKTYGLPSQLYYLLDRYYQHKILIPKYLKYHNVITVHSLKNLAKSRIS